MHLRKYVYSLVIARKIWPERPRPTSKRGLGLQGKAREPHFPKNGWISSLRNPHNLRNGPNTVLESTVSKTELSEFFRPHWVPAFYYLPKRPHRVWRRTHRVLSAETVLSKQTTPTAKNKKQEWWQREEKKRRRTPPLKKNNDVRRTKDVLSECRRSGTSITQDIRGYHAHPLRHCRNMFWPGEAESHGRFLGRMDFLQISIFESLDLLSRILPPDFLSSYLRERVSRNILQDNLSKLIQQNPDTFLQRGQANESDTVSWFRPKFPGSGIRKELLQHVGLIPPEVGSVSLPPLDGGKRAF